MSELSKEFLEIEYVKKFKSTYQIAEECNTYSNKIRRLLKKYGIPIRDKGEAQAVALGVGRHTHPTKGKHHSEETKDLIRKRKYERTQ